MSNSVKDHSKVLTRVVLTFSMTVVAGTLGTVTWMFVVPDVGEASFAAFFSGIVWTILVLCIECVVLAIIYRQHRWIALGLVSTPILMVLAYFGFIKLLEVGL